VASASPGHRGLRILWLDRGLKDREVEVCCHAALGPAKRTVCKAHSRQQSGQHSSEAMSRMAA
jgi:hypothetical protein